MIQVYIGMFIIIVLLINRILRDSFKRKHNRYIKMRNFRNKYKETCSVCIYGQFFSNLDFECELTLNNYNQCGYKLSSDDLLKEDIEKSIPFKYNCRYYQCGYEDFEKEKELKQFIKDVQKYKQKLEIGKLKINNTNIVKDLFDKQVKK